MNKAQLLLVLNTLTPAERARWTDFVGSPYFTRNTYLRALNDSLASHANPGGSLDKRAVFQQVYGPYAVFDVLKLNNLISDLLELLQQFLALRRWEQETAARQLLLADELLERDLAQVGKTVLAKAANTMAKQKDVSIDRQRAEQRWWEVAERLYSRQSGRNLGEHLARVADALDIRLVLEKLRLGCVMLSRNSLAVVEAYYRPRWLDQIRQWAIETPLLYEHPAVRTYLQALDLLENPDTDHFEAFKSQLEATYPCFPPDELRELYQYALNYCIRAINDGRPNAYQDAWNLYRTLLERGILSRRGRMSQWTYKNIATAGLRAGAFEWTEAFIRQYRASLAPEVRDNAFAFNLAALYFEQHRYGPALRTLQGVEFTDFTYHLGAKIIQLKSYFLLGEAEALESLLSATEKVLRRNRSLSQYGRTANLNFLRALRLLHRRMPVRAGRPSAQRKNRVAALRVELETLHPLANKDWLLSVLS